MKKAIYAIAIFIILAMSNSIQAQTTVADGNWSNPATWGGVPPTGSGTVVINHNVTLDIDYAHVAGSITINASGSLTGSTSLRYFALNFPTGTASLTNYGTFHVARVPLYAGTVINGGTFINDSLLNNANLTNNSGGIINANQFMINTGASIVNNGTINSTYFLNIETTTNNNTLTAYDLHNSKSFTNSTTGMILISHDFSNSDTLASPAVFTNDGLFACSNDWSNSANCTIQGSGRFCVQNLSNNSGTMQGTFDFCDQTGGPVDYNTGTIAATITTCQFPCNIGVNEMEKNLAFNIYPNPFSNSTIIQVDGPLANATLIVYNVFGQAVKQINDISGQTITIQRDNLSAGLYFVRLMQDNRLLASDKIVITD